LRVFYLVSFLFSQLLMFLFRTKSSTTLANAFPQKPKKNTNLMLEDIFLYFRHFLLFGRAWKKVCFENRFRVWFAARQCYKRHSRWQKPEVSDKSRVSGFGQNWRFRFRTKFASAVLAIIVEIF
jgi:hypothetical protein